MVWYDDYDIKLHLVWFELNIILKAITLQKHIPDVLLHVGSNDFPMSQLHGPHSYFPGNLK